MSDLEILSSGYFSAKHGEDLPNRMRKLTEEVIELIRAITEHERATDPADRMRKAERVREEVSDVQVVLTHIAVIMGISFEECLINARVKNKVREHVPWYMRCNDENAKA